MKVIFLDIDGVLNSRAYDKTRSLTEQSNIDETRLPLVKKIVDETGARIVLSSTWREHWCADTKLCDSDGVYINDVFAKFGLRIYDKTPDLGHGFDRPDEITAWLKYAEEPIESFVILDDYNYGWGKLSDSFVKTNPVFGRGLENEHVKAAIEILLPENRRTDKAKYNISIVGDSISTYVGYNPKGYRVFYNDDTARANGLESVEDTWWKQVINGLGGRLCVNNSYSGSFVAYEDDTSACSDARCSALHNDATPDIILIYMGTNDRGYEVAVGIDDSRNIKKFYGAYRCMLSRIKSNYPTAKIVCATLLIGKAKEGMGIDFDLFMEEDELYNQAIRLAVKEEGCILADLALSDVRYEAHDCCHPTGYGHKQMATLWLDSLKSLL